MEFFKIRRTIPFMRHALVFNVISLITFLAAVFFLSTRHLHFSVEFTGGTLMEVTYQHTADVERVRQALDSAGLKAEVQNFGSSRDVLIRLPVQKDVPGAQTSQKVTALLQADDKSAEVRRVEFVGPQVGGELAETGAVALLLTSVAIVLYLWLRFVNWRFGLAAIVANLHDVVIILGFFAFFQWEFSLPVLAGVLAVLGYSVNESVVVFDRVRENFRKMRRASVPEVIDAVGAGYPVLVDGGFRRGTDIYKALALGAKAVGIGRGYIYGLAAFGQEGVERVIDILRAELALTMRQCGTPSISQITRASILRNGQKV